MSDSSTKPGRPVPEDSVTQVSERARTHCALQRLVLFILEDEQPCCLQLRRSLLAPRP